MLCLNFLTKIIQVLTIIMIRRDRPQDLSSAPSEIPSISKSPTLNSQHPSLSTIPSDVPSDSPHQVPSDVSSATLSGAAAPSATPSTMPTIAMVPSQSSSPSSSPSMSLSPSLSLMPTSQNQVLHGNSCLHV